VIAPLSKIPARWGAANEVPEHVFTILPGHNDSILTPGSAKSGGLFPKLDLVQNVSIQVLEGFVLSTAETVSTKPPIVFDGSSFLGS
jgi:hypothetical protein